MRFFRKMVNPLMAFIGIQVIWIVVVVSWISWFMGSHRKLRSLAEKYSPELLQRGVDWFILVEGLVLLLAILAGVYVIFLFWRRQAALYRAQRDFIAQVSHELKSPLASLQLHLETIRRRRPPPQKMDTFLDTMLADTDRLDTLVTNMLTTNRLEQKRLKLALQRCNLSELVNSYFRRHQYSLPKAGKMNLEVEPELYADIEVESLETVLRNLLENALLYSSGPPGIEIALRRDGKRAHLTFRDHGRGIPPQARKKVFRMFYRVRPPGETIRGSGLGLFIVAAMVRLHRGRVWLESSGDNKGTTVHILLPLKPAPEGETQ